MFIEISLRASSQIKIAIRGRAMDNIKCIPLNEKRFLDMKDFQDYTSIGRNNAMKLAHSTGCIVKVGRKLLVDRVKFDLWCDENTFQELLFRH